MKFMEHWRIQRPVGQGGFHSAGIKYQGGVLRYIYDCGSDSDEKYLTAEIKRFAKRPERIRGKKACDSGVEFFFLSHFDRDHVNGLKKLLLYVRIETLVLPYLPVEFRLCLVARELGVENPDTEKISFLRDPILWFEGLSNVGRIVFIKSGFDELDDGLEGDASEPDLPQHLLGMNLRSFRDGGKVTKAHILIGNDQNHTVLNATSPERKWILKTFVPPLNNMRELLRKNLACELTGGNVTDLEGLLNDPKRFANCLDDEVNGTANRKRIAKAYTKAAKECGDKGAGGHNRVSMCLYSGPDTHSVSDEQYGVSLVNRFNGRRSNLPFNGDYYPYKCLYSSFLRIGWMGTGDSCFGDKNIFEAFLQHFTAELEHLSSFQVPHHGAVGNMPINFTDLREETNLTSLFVCHGNTNQFGHPDHATIAELVENGYKIHSVTENSQSAMIEVVDW